MRTYITTLFLFISFLVRAIHCAPDSLILKIDKRNQNLIGAKGANSTLKEELESAFEKKGMVLTDSLWQNVRQIIKTETEGDSSLTIKIDNNLVKIALYKSIEKYKNDMGLKNRQKVPGGPVMKYDEGADQVKSRDKKEVHIDLDGVQVKSRDKKEVLVGLDGVQVKSRDKEEVLVGLDGVHVKEGNEETHITWDGIYHREGKEVTKVIWGKDSTKIHPKDQALYKRSGLNLYVGFNGLGGQIPAVTTMQYPQPYMMGDIDLKPTGARYVSIEISRDATLARGPKSAFKIGYGISWDWYNFMFDHNRVVQKTPNAVIFQPLLDAKGQETTFSKNKLTVSYVTLPIMPHVVFPKKSSVQMIAFGGYISYRVDSWTKTIEEKSEILRRENSNFHLNQIRYGLRAEIKLRHFPDFFFHYDFNSLFATNFGPKMNAYSFGIRLL